MKRTVIVMVNNWLSDIHCVIKFNNIDTDKLLSIHAEYYQNVNETHIIIWETE